MSTFREWTPAPAAMRVGGVLLAALFASLTALAMTGPIQVQARDRAIFGVCMVVGVLLGLAAASQSLLLEIDKTRVRVRLFPFYWREFDVGDIASVCKGEIEPSRYGGFGVRRVPGRPLAVYQRGGHALEFHFVDDRVVLVECHDADHALQLLSRYVPGTA